MSESAPVLTPEQVSHVQSSFAQVVPIADTAADLFYNRLFELDSGLRRLFNEDMREQKKALMAMLAVAVNNLGRLDTIVPAVQALGKRHGGYGVRDSDYDTVGAALIWTLEKGLGDGFTPNTRQAWLATYGVLAGTMKAAANA